MKRRMILFFLVLFGCFIIFMNDVNAISVTMGNHIAFSSYGLTSDSKNTHTSHKKSGNDDVYCIQFKKTFSNGDYTASNCTTNGINKGLTETHYIVAGQIVDIIDSKSWNADKKYAYKVAVLNNYFRSLKLSLSSGSAQFSGSSEISKIISEAKTRAKYYGSKKSYNISKPSISVSTASLKLVSGTTDTFVSNAITFESLNDTFNGTKPTYTFSAKSSDTNFSGKIYLCTGVNSGCTLANSVKVSGVKSKVYYLKVTGAKEKTNISVTITGDSSINYVKGGVYCKGTVNQAILKVSKKEQKYSNKNTVTFSVPDTTNHQIVISKVDDFGNPLVGAEFELYDGNTKLNLVKQSNNSTFKYTTPIVDSSVDKFFNKTYTYKEISTPNGYVMAGEAKIDVGANDSNACYDENSNKVDSGYCNKNIISMCKITKTVLKATEGENNSSGTETEPDVTSTYSEISENGCLAPENTETETYTAEVKCVLKRNDNYTEQDSKYCENKDKYFSIEVSSGNIFINRVNLKNSIKISKVDATGNEEVSGAHLKICTEADYNSKKMSCSTAKTVDDVELSWVSSDSPATFNGLKFGTYYIIEELPPAGYKTTTTATKFSIDKTGKITIGSTKSDDNVIVINNALNDLSISKTDIVTKKELAGAKLSICSTVTSNVDTKEGEEENENSENTSENNTNKKYTLEVDQNGECLPAVLADGTSATWTSTDKPHYIKGLPAGTYYLVENTAPLGYSTAESILFTMKADGTLLDKDGKVIGDKKIVMYDDPIKQVPTGMLSIYMILGIVLAAAGVGVGTYYYSSKGIRRFAKNNGKIRMRKIHK